MLKATFENEFGMVNEMIIETHPDIPEYHHWACYNPLRDQWVVGTVFSDLLGVRLVAACINHMTDGNFRQWNTPLIAEWLNFELESLFQLTRKEDLVWRRAHTSARNSGLGARKAVNPTPKPGLSSAAD